MVQICLTGTAFARARVLSFAVVVSHDYISVFSSRLPSDHAFQPAESAEPAVKLDTVCGCQNNQWPRHIRGFSKIAVGCEIHII